MQVLVLFVAACLVGTVPCQETDDDYEADYLDNGVQTPSGRVMGVTTEFYGVLARAYLGIPYAKPPLDDLRFKKPVAVEPWTDTLSADTVPSACVQYAEYYSPTYDVEEGKSEDCLYLNIWSPRIAPEKEKVPVMFWIHGGEYVTGSNRLMSENGLGLAQIGRVLVVSPNYRLGPLGFFSSGSEDAPGNAGVYDIIEALQWVRKNIASFGGDPERITIFGQGAGSALVSLFLVSPLTEGLFSKAIMQSGTFLNHIDKDSAANNLDLGQRLAEAVGCANQSLAESPKDVVECLRDVEADQLARSMATLKPTPYRNLSPQTGDDFLPQDPHSYFKAGKFHNVPLMIGTNKDEGAALLTKHYPDLFGRTGRKDLIIGKSFAANILRTHFRHIPDTEAVVQQYLEDVDAENEDEIKRQVYTALGDYNVTCPTVYFAEQFHNGNNTVQFYVFNQRLPSTPWAPWMGATDHEEVPFVFGRPVDGYTYRTFMEFYTGELGLSYVMASTWAKFAKDGNAIDMWKNYSKNHHQYYLWQYDVQRQMRGPGPHLDNCNFLRKYFDL